MTPTDRGHDVRNPEAPFPDGREETPNGPIWSKSTRGHSLASLVELNNLLSGSSDTLESARVLLLSLAGQVGTSRGLLWMDAMSEGSAPEVLAAQGIAGSLARALVAAGTEDMRERAQRKLPPWSPTQEPGACGRPFELLANEAGIAIFAASVMTAQRVVFVGLGPLPNRRSYGALETGVLEASMAVAGMALGRLDLCNARTESNRRLRQTVFELNERERITAKALERAARSLQTPLVILRECLEQISDRLPEGAKPRAEVARAAISTIERTIESIVLPPDLVRPPTPSDLPTVELVRFIEGIVRERAAGASCSRCQLRLETSGAPLVARCEPSGLLRVLNGVLDTLMDRARVGTEFHVRLEPSTAEGHNVARVTIRASRDLNWETDPSSHAHSSSSVISAPEHAGKLDELRRAAYEIGARFETGIEPDGGHTLELELPLDPNGEPARDEPLQLPTRRRRAA